MKNKECVKPFIPKDDTYTHNFAVKSGDKYDHDREMITDLEINQMCVDINKSKIENFILLLVEGENAQKESVLDNLHYYADSETNSLKIFQTIKKNYPHLTDCLYFMANGIHKWMINVPTNTNKECMEIIEEIAYRTVSQNPAQVQDWEKVIEYLGKINELSFEKEWNYINGAFSVNSPPEKRRVAFCMIHHLMESSKDIKSAALGKILFFNQDTDPNTRYLICCIMKKVLEVNPHEDEVWRAVWEYHRDKDENVSQHATEILCSLQYSSNFSLLINEFDDEKKEGVMSKNLETFLICFRDQIEEDQKSNLIIISFINRIFKSQKTENICLLFKSLNTNTLDIIRESRIYEDVTFNALPLMDVDVIEHLLVFYQNLENVEFKEALKAKLLKTLKEVQYEVFGSSKEIAELLDLSQEDDVNVYLAICSKMLEVSKWYSLIPMLEVFIKLVMHQSLYEKVCSFLLKLWIGCPSFLQEKVADCALYLMLINKRNLEFLITIREKILNSKFWNHRKSYIIFYSTMKAETSFEYHKFIPTLAYKTMVLDKSIGVRLTLSELIPKIYKHIEPANSAEKALIREAVSKLEEDKDEFVKEKAIVARKEIELTDKNHVWLATTYERSREMALREQTLGQVSYEPKRITKTEHELLKMNKPKRLNTDKRKTINVVTKGMHREPSIENISVSSSKQTNSTAPKRSNLFRCHSVKIKAPVKKS